MNSFGNLFKVQIFGESHGLLVGILIDGCPAGLPIMPEDFKEDLDRRKGVSQKEQHQEKKKIIPKLKVVFLIILVQDFQLVLSSKIKMFVVPTMNNNVVFQGPVMPIGSHIKNLEAMKITEVEAILVPDSLPVWLLLV